jgi:hypothetical protein
MSPTSQQLLLLLNFIRPSRTTLRLSLNRLPFGLQSFPVHILRILFRNAGPSGLSLIGVRQDQWQKLICRLKIVSFLWRSNNTNDTTVEVSVYWMSYGMDDRGSIPTASRPALGPTQLPIKCASGDHSSDVKWLGREADHSPPSREEVKNAWSYTSILP